MVHFSKPHVAAFQMQKKEKSENEKTLQFTIVVLSPVQMYFTSFMKGRRILLFFTISLSSIPFCNGEQNFDLFLLF